MEFTDHYIDINDIIPPLPGGYKFEAKVIVSFGDESIPHKKLPFVAWGKTEAEADQKAEAELRKWIAKNGRRVEPKDSSQNPES